jgi:hypothetical protein
VPPVRLGFVVRPPLGAGPSPHKGRGNQLIDGHALCRRERGIRRRQRLGGLLTTTSEPRDELGSRIASAAIWGHDDAVDLRASS